MVNFLRSPQIFQFVGDSPDEKASLKNMSKPDKIYCDNPNLMYALCTEVNTGNLRETFFLNQIVSSGNVATYPYKGDFMVNENISLKSVVKTKHLIR